MTFQKSLTYKNVSPYALRSSFRAGIIPFLVYTLLLFILCPLQSFSFLYNKYIAISLHEYEEDITHLSERYVYAVLPDSSDLSIYITLITLITGTLVGVSLFRFITSKKTVNVYYSLGITRTSLFLSRYFAGLALLFAAIALPVGLSCAVNIIFIGFSKELLISTAYIMLSIFSLAVLTFSVTSAVMSVVGTIIEGVGFTAMLMLIPSGFVYMIELLSETMLYGTPLRSSYYHRNIENFDLLTRTGKFNTILYLYSIFNDDSIGMLLKSDIDGSLTAQEVISNHMYPMVAVIWTAVGLAVTALGIYLFNKRKAEICGFFGMSKTLNFVTELITGLIVFTLSITFIYEDMKAFSFAVTVSGIALSFIVINLIFTRSFKKTFRKIYLLGAEYISVIIIFTIFATGGFGYSSRIPELDEIESANISTVAYENLLLTDEAMVYSYYGNNGFSAFTNSPNHSALGPYTSHEDLQKILKIHSKLISLKQTDKSELFNTGIIVHYTLTDGSKLCRFYSHADLETLNMNLQLYDSDYYKNEIEKTFNGEIQPSEYYHDFYDYSQLNMDYGSSAVIAVGPSINSNDFKFMELDEAQFNALKAAVASDLNALTADQYYTPDKPAAGAIVFRRFSSLVDYNQGEAVEIDESRLYEHVFRTDIIEAETSIMLTDDMVNTLNFLEQNQLMRYFPAASPAEVESISFIPAVIDKSDISYINGVEFIIDFLSSNQTPFIGSYYAKEDISRQNEITDQAKISEILKLSHMRYYTSNQGYVCIINYKDGETVMKYIADGDAPDYVKSYNYLTAQSDYNATFFAGVETAEVSAVY